MYFPTSIRVDMALIACLSLDPAADALLQRGEFTPEMNRPFSGQLYAEEENQPRSSEEEEGGDGRVAVCGGRTSEGGGSY